jgi:glycosyltransferase involved in cell wall biosynthesis
LSEIPLLPSYKTDWPWFGDRQKLPRTMPNGSAWPLISIVTPSYNQGQFLEETIRSVLLQGYPNLEYIIIDGGSTDESVEIIKKYEPWLAYWVSEKDRGQSHAINKGFERATGEIMAWINSDDYFEVGAFALIANAYYKYPSSEWYAGKCYFIYSSDVITEEVLQPIDNSRSELWLVNCRVMQPSTFWKTSLWKKINGIDEYLHYSFDYDLWLQFVAHQVFPTYIDHPLAYFRFHPESKTKKNRDDFYKEDKIVQTRYKYLANTFVKKINVWRLRKELLARRKIKNSKNKLYTIRMLLLYAPWLLSIYIRSFINKRIVKILRLV